MNAEEYFKLSWEEACICPICKKPMTAKYKSCKHGSSEFRVHPGDFEGFNQPFSINIECGGWILYANRENDNVELFKSDGKAIKYYPQLMPRKSLLLKDYTFEDFQMLMMFA